MVPRPAATALPGSLLEMQNLGLTDALMTVAHFKFDKHERSARDEVTAKFWLSTDSLGTLNDSDTRIPCQRLFHDSRGGQPVH